MRVIRYTLILNLTYFAYYLFFHFYLESAFLRQDSKKSSNIMVSCKFLMKFSSRHNYSTFIDPIHNRHRIVVR